MTTLVNIIPDNILEYILLGICGIGLVLFITIFKDISKENI